jgi:hypothetical protein
MRISSGSFFLVPALFAVTAMILSIVTVSKCDLVQPAPEVTDNPIYDLFDDLPDATGLYGWKTNGGDCQEYGDPDQFDKPFRAARAMGILAVVLGFVIVLAFVFAGFRKLEKSGFIVIGMLAILNTLFQGLVFLVFKSEICQMECAISTGGNVAISSCVLWALTGLFGMFAGDNKST